MADVLHFLEQAGENIARPFVATGADVSNAIGNAEVRAGQALGIKANTGVETNQQQFGKTIGNFAGTDTPMHFLENVGQVGLGVAAPGIGEAGAAALGVGGKIAEGAIGGAATGGTFNALAGASQGQTSGKDLAMNFLSGTAGGAVLGAGGAAAGQVLSKVGGKLISSLGEPALKAGEQASGLTRDNIINDTETETLKDYADRLSGDLQLKAPAVNQLEQNARGSAQAAGIDITSGSPNERIDRIYNYISQRRQFIQAHDQVAQGGYFKLPSNASDDLVRSAFTSGTDDNSLYHGTKYDNAVNILKSGSIKASQPNSSRELITDSADKQVSLSRQRNSGFYNSKGADVKFVVDKNRIGKTTQYVDGELKPSDYTNPSIFEAEEQYKNDIPLSAVKRIEGGALLEPEDEQTLRALAAKHNIPFVGFDDTKDMRQILGSKDGSSPAKQLFTSEKLQDMAENENTSQIEKDLTPQLGPVLAQKTAPAVAVAKDPEIVSNIIDNAVKQHLPVEQPKVGNEVTPPAEVPTGASAETPQFEGPELQAQRGMQDIINNGGTVDEALNHHMEVTGGTFGDAKEALAAVRGAVGTESGHINASLNPEWDKLKIPEADSDERAVLNSRMVRNEATRAANTAAEEIDKLSPNDLRLMDELRTTSPEELAQQAEDKQQFLKAANLVKKFNDTVQAIGAGQLKQDVPYRQNYGAPLLFDRSTPEAEQLYQDSVNGLPTKPGYGKQRFFKNYDEAAQVSHGQLQRQNENFLGDFILGAQRRISDLSQLTLAKGLDQVHPGEVRVGRIGTDEGGTYSQLQIPGGNKLSLPKAIADEINKRAPALEPTGGLAKYDTLNSNLKNFKLAGGGFHSINVIGSYLGHQIASGKLFTPSGIGDLGNVIKTTFSQRSFDSTLNDMAGRGKLTDADAAGLKYGRGETQADIHATGKLENIPLLKQIHEGIFNRQIPMLKLQIFDQQTRGLDRNNPEDLKQMTAIAKGLNNAFGGVNREIQGLTPKQFQMASRAFLATDYNEGQLRTLANAFNPKANPAERKLAQQIVFGKALLFGGLATAAGAAGGEFQGKTPQQTAFDILEKFANPEFKFGQYTVGLPTTQISELAKPIQQTVQGYKYNGSLTEGAQNFATNRLAAVPSEALQILGNKNYLGQPVRGVDTHGRPISPLTTAENVASGVVPIPVSQAGQTATGNQSIGAAIANTIGLRTTATNQASKLPIAQQTYIQTLQQNLPNTWSDKQKSEVVDAITNFDSIIKQNSQARAKVDTQINKDIAAGNMDKAKADANAFNQQLYQSLSKALSSSTAQYLDIPIQGQQTPYKYLTDNYNGYFTNLNINSRKTTINHNPTKYGLKIGEHV